MKKAPGVNRGQCLFSWVAVRLAELYVCCVFVGRPVMVHALFPGRPFNHGTNYEWCTECRQGKQ